MLEVNEHMLQTETSILLHMKLAFDHIKNARVTISSPISEVHGGAVFFSTLVAMESVNECVVFFRTIEFIRFNDDGLVLVHRSAWERSVDAVLFDLECAKDATPEHVAKLEALRNPSDETRSLMERLYAHTHDMESLSLANAVMAFAPVRPVFSTLLPTPKSVLHAFEQRKTLAAAAASPDANNNNNNHHHHHDIELGELSSVVEVAAAYRALLSAARLIAHSSSRHVFIHHTRATHMSTLTIVSHTGCVVDTTMLAHTTFGPGTTGKIVRREVLFGDSLTWHSIMQTLSEDCGAGAGNGVEADGEHDAAHEEGEEEGNDGDVEYDEEEGVQEGEEDEEEEEEVGEAHEEALGEHDVVMEDDDVVLVGDDKEVEDALPSTR